MGLFDGKAKQESAEKEVIQKLANAPILDLLIDNVIKASDEESWIMRGQNYYDKCRRTVIVEPDVFGIKWSSMCDKSYIDNDGQRKTQRVEEVQGEICYSYTKSGYLLLHSYSYDDGKKNTDRESLLFVGKYNS